jgi:hypothetical protein
LFGFCGRLFTSSLNWSIVVPSTVRIITGVGDVVNVQPEVDEVDDDAVGVDVDVGIVDVGPDDPVLWKLSNNPNSSRTA